MNLLDFSGPSAPKNPVHYLYGQLVLAVILFSWSLNAEAHEPEEGKTWGTTGPFIYQTDTKHKSSASAPFVGGGLVAEGDVDDNGGVEIGMFYIDKFYLRRVDDTVLGERIKRMYITTGYRHWFSRQVSAALAFYSSYSMGDPKVITGPSEGESDYQTTARKITEHGVDLSWQFEAWSDDQQSVVFDARYSKAINAMEDERANVYGLLIGLKRLIPVGKKAN